MRALPPLLAALLLTTACLSPRDALSPRWFRPAMPAVEPRPAAPDAPAVRLRPVASAGHLGERISWRTGDVEYGRHELLRWLEVPDDVVHQGLVDALFVSGLARRSERPDAAVLEVSVVRFEEVRQPSHRVEVELLATLRDDRGSALMSRRFAGGASLADDDPATLARQMGVAAGEQIDELVDAAVAALIAAR
jgi:uncharacterized lipoprotein YmbA